jgi:hypothetical protein
MAKINWVAKHDQFRTDIIERLKMKVYKSKLKSDFNINKPILKVEDAQFNLDGGRYLIEVSGSGLIDNCGYDYNFDVLTTEDLNELANELL